MNRESNKETENINKSQILTTENGYVFNVNKNNIVEIETCETHGKAKLKSELRRVQKEIHRKSAKQQSLEILCNPCFILLLANIFLFLFGCSVVFTHIIAFAESQGISSSLGRVLVSILGGAGITGRLEPDALDKHLRHLHCCCIINW